MFGQNKNALNSVPINVNKNSFHDEKKDYECLTSKNLEKDFTPLDVELQVKDEQKQPLKYAEMSSSFDLEIEGYIKRCNAKDSGYAWVVLAAMLCSNALTGGYMKSFGMTYNTVLQSYPDTSGTMAGLMMGLLAGCRSVFAPVAGAISNAIGARKSIGLGAAICCIGLFSSYFCTSVAQLSVTLGAMMGTGFCLIETCQVVVVADYFEAKLSTANGIRVAGNTLGGILYPMMIVLLMDEYGVKLMRIIMTGILLHFALVAALTRPFKTHQRIQILEAINSKENLTMKAETKRSLYKNILASFPEARCRIKKPLEFIYLTNPVYMIFIAMLICIALSLPLLIYYLPIYGHSIGLTPTENFILLSVQSVLDLLFRLTFGWMNDRNWYKKVHGLILCLIVGGVGILLIPKCHALWSILFMTSMFTVGSSAYYAYINVILTDQFGKSSISTTWGFVRMVQGIVGFIYPSLLGYIADASGSFTIPFVVMGSGMVMSGLILLMEPLVIRFTHSKVVVT